jgi:hypothetical protein
VLLAASAGLGTAAYWVTYAQYLSGGAPAVSDLTYFTRLPWPLLLSLSMALDVAVVVAGARHVLRSPCPVWVARPPGGVE